MFRNTILLINFYHFLFACMKLFYIFAVCSKNVKPLSVFVIEEYWYLLCILNINPMILCRNIFPLLRISVSINDKKISLAPGGSVEMPLEKSDHYVIEIVSPLLLKKNSKTVSDLHENSVIEIKTSLPDSYYLLMGGVSLVICVLFFLQMVPAIIFGMVLLLYIFPIVYHTFVKADEYFSICVR